MNQPSVHATVRGRGRAVTLGVLVAAALFGALFPWFPGQPVLEPGVIAPRTVTAPRDATYESDLRTEATRAERAAAVPDVIEDDARVRERQIALLGQQLAEIDAIRSDRSVSASARETAIRGVPETSLSQAAAAVLALASDEEWEALAAEARQALERVLRGTIGDADVESARRSLRGLLARLPDARVLALGELLDPLVVPTQVVNEQRTEAERANARAAVDVIVVPVERGEVLVEQGRVLSAEDIEKLEKLGLRSTGVRALDVAATALLAGLLGAACGGFLYVAQPASLSGVRRLVLFALLLLVPAAAAKFSLPLLLPDEQRHFLPYALPLAAAPIAAAVLLDVGVAILLAALIATVAAFVTVYLPEAAGAQPLTQLDTARMWLVVMAGSFGGLLFAARADRLQRYLVAGVAAAFASGAALVIFWLLDAGRRALDLLWLAGASAAGGLLAVLIAVGAFVLLSRPFGIITRVELMELAQLNRPLLRRLQDEAPGTFQHSVLVGNLAERAADRIGANALLVRVGAYYHDVGKLVAPSFFIENAAEGESPHEGLDPLQSTRVIHQHVTGGIEIARREGLPEAVVQFIPQHHGTRLMTFFYRRAAAEDEEIDPEVFRYPGPRPQSRETALVMLADGCEATVRSSPDRSLERVAEIVEAVIRERIEEGQFEECDLSLRDLRVVADSYASALSAVYHPRVEYPEPTDRELAERGAAPLPERDADGQEPATAAGGEIPPLTRPQRPSPPPSQAGDERRDAAARGEDDA